VIEVFKADDGWRFRVKGANGEIQASGESYTSHADAERGVNDLIKTILRDVAALDYTVTWTRKPEIGDTVE